MHISIVHVQGGNVRVLRNGRQVTISKAKAAFLHESEPYQIVACPTNYGLIAAAATVAGKGTHPVTLVSPIVPGIASDYNWHSVVGTLLQRSVWRRLWTNERKMQSTDGVVYAVSTRLLGDAPDAGLIHHPAWNALSSLPGYSPRLACEFLDGFTDLYWYGHPTRRGRISRLLRKLRVDPAGVGKAMSSKSQQRHGPLEALIKLSTGGESGLDAHAVCRACRRSVQFVYHVWMGEICPVSGQSTFDPDQFFADSDKAADYVDRATKAKQTRKGDTTWNL